MIGDVNDELFLNIERREHLFHLLTIACQKKIYTDNEILRVLDELLWGTKDNPEQYARIEETRRYLEILNAMGRNVLEEELNRQNCMLENSREIMERKQRQDS